jgi:hypothetical protein
LAVRASTYIYGLIYPAFLGTFLVSALSLPVGDCVTFGIIIAALLYFIAQYGEGATAAQRNKTGDGDAFGWPEMLCELFEICVMTMAFGALGLFERPPGSLANAVFADPSLERHWCWLAIAFLHPPISRIFLSSRGRSWAQRNGSLRANRLLVGLSGIAAAGAVIGGCGFPRAGLALISVSLFFYFVLFILCPACGEGPKTAA